MWCFLEANGFLSREPIRSCGYKFYISGKLRYIMEGVAPHERALQKNSLGASGSREDFPMTSTEARDCNGPFPSLSIKALWMPLGESHASIKRQIESNNVVACILFFKLIQQ